MRFRKKKFRVIAAERIRSGKVFIYTSDEEIYYVRNQSKLKDFFGLNGNRIVYSLVYEDVTFPFNNLNFWEEANFDGTRRMIMPIQGIKVLDSKIHSRSGIQQLISKGEIFVTKRITKDFIGKIYDKFGNFKVEIQCSPVDFNEIDIKYLNLLKHGVQYNHLKLKVNAI
jgi:hypothetical protein